MYETTNWNPVPIGSSLARIEFRVCICGQLL